MMGKENQLYNLKSNINKNKVLVVLDKIIYPESFKKIINKMDLKNKEFEFNMFLKNSYVWVLSMHDTNSERLDLVTNEIRDKFWKGNLNEVENGKKS